MFCFFSNWYSQDTGKIEGVWYFALLGNQLWKGRESQKASITFKSNIRKKNSIIIQWLFAWNFHLKTDGVNLLISFSINDPEKESVNFNSI